MGKSTWATSFHGLPWATVRIPCASRTIPVHDLNESDALFHHASSGKQLSAERPRDVF